LPLEISKAGSLPGARHVWKATAVHHNVRGSTPRGAGTRGRGFRAAQKAHAHAARSVCLHRAQASLAVCHGRRAAEETQLLFGAGCHFAFSEAARPALAGPGNGRRLASPVDRKSTRLNSSHVKISYAVFCLKKKKK